MLGLAMMLWGCSQPIVYEATVTDALGNKPVAGANIQFQAPDAAQPACKRMELVTTTDGTLKIDGLCSADTAYTLAFGSGGWAFDQVVTVPVGGVQGVQALKAWPVPDESGVYKFTGAAFEPVAFRTVMVQDPFLGHPGGFWYPEAQPTSLPKLAAGDRLVFYGVDANSKYRLDLLHDVKFEVNSGPAPAPADPAGGKPVPAPGYKMSEFSTVGSEFTDPTTLVDRPRVEPDASKLIKADLVGKPIQYVQIEAWPPGRYALWSEADRRGTLFEIAY